MTLALCLASAGCGDLLGYHREPGVSLSRKHVTDTIEARVRVLVVVRDERGNALGGVPVQVVASGPPYPRFNQLITDGNGAAFLELRLPPTAGHQRLLAGYGFDQDTLHITTRPGNPVGVAHAPGDTAVLVSAEWEADVRLGDRNGNARSERVAANSIVSADRSVVVAAGSHMEAVGRGRAEVRLHTLEGIALLNVSVLPDDQLAVFPGPQLVTLTGAPAGALPPLLENCLSWHPDGERFLASGLRVIDMNGTATVIDAGPAAPAGCGVFTADGEWIYFQGRQSKEIWRVHPDGTALEMLVSVAPRLGTFSPSPDGSRVAFVLQTVIGSAVVIHEVATGATDTIVRFSGVTVADVGWSPTGEWIAIDHVTVDYRYRSPRYYHSLVVMSPDGTRGRNVSGGHVLRPGWSWSPDGRWLVATEYYTDRLLVIDIEQNTTTLSTQRTAGMLNPLWRPRRSAQ